LSLARENNNKEEKGKFNLKGMVEKKCMGGNSYGKYKMLAPKRGRDMY